MRGRVGIALRQSYGQAGHFRDRLTHHRHEAGRQYLSGPNASRAQVKKSESRHRIDVGKNAGAEFAPRNAIELFGTVGVVAPLQIVVRDPKRLEDTLEHEIL